jgi:hypothetical protein
MIAAVIFGMKDRGNGEENGVRWIGAPKRELSVPL